jgi:hypothetical protein
MLLSRASLSCPGDLRARDGKHAIDADTNDGS